MSEADNLNINPDLPEPADLVPVASSGADSQADEGWETVNFPGALNVDAIPKAVEPIAQIPVDAEVYSALVALGETTLEDGAIAQAEPEPKVHSLESDFAVRLQQLQQENGDLRDRITELEQDLTQQQIEFQLEVARSLHTNSLEAAPPPVAMQPLQDLTLAQKRVNDLLQELEISKQSAQRQRILVETLTEQLESSQERVAQLERDCALAQQRYNEQVQQLLQAENTCRDLRMRLHRQQRHTLQFKAALEKCLEMPAAQRQSQFLPHLNLENHPPVPTVSIPPTVLSQVLTPKNQPVRPWSAVSEAQSDTEAGDDLPRPLSRLLHPDAVQETDVSAEMLSWNAANQPEDLQTAADWMNQIFPATSANGEGLAIAPQSSNIFDLSPFIDTDDSDTEAPANAAPPTTSGDDRLLQMLAAVPLDSDELGSPLEAFHWGQSTQPEDALWDDLTRLIEMPKPSENLVSETKEPAVDSVNETTEAIALASEPLPTDGMGDRLDPASPPPTPQPTSTGGKKPLELVSWASHSNKPSRSSHLRPVATAPDESLLPDEEGQPVPAVAAVSPDSSSKPTGDLLTGSWPSPVVYPLRSSKRLKSLAAVDLPSFPKAR